MKNIIKITGITLLTFFLFSAPGYAQTEANSTVNATGDVLEAVAISGTNLQFGEIIPGIENSISPTTDASSAQFDITGAAGKEVQATFTLPTELTGPGNALSLTFSSTSAAHAQASTEQGTATTFDPSTGVTTTLSGTGALFLWLGGSVTAPHTGQTAGSYTADITLQVVYTGS